jgi:inorganic phosphate transporter, PiT family
VLLAVALAFAFVSGMNDGASVLALASRHLRRRGILLVLLAVATVAVPALVTDEVAATLAVRLVSFDASDAAVPATLALAGAAVAALVVVGVMSRRGTPTSLTLALIGGMVGAAIPAGLPVGWRWVALSVAVAIAAPFAGALVALCLQALLRLFGVGFSSSALFRAASVVGFVALVAAYAVNDGQKLIALLAVAVGTAQRPGALGAGVLALAAALFLGGAVVGVHRVAATLAGRVVLARVPQIVLAQFGASAAVLGSAALLAPVSMTQSIAGALVGATGSAGWRRVRWRAALEVVIAWLVTLPAAFALGAVVAWALRLVP